MCAHCWRAVDPASKHARCLEAMHRANQSYSQMFAADLFRLVEYGLARIYACTVSAPGPASECVTQSWLYAEQLRPREAA